MYEKNRREAVLFLLLLWVRLMGMRRGGGLCPPGGFSLFFFVSDGILSFLGERKYPKNAI